MGEACLLVWDLERDIERLLEHHEIGRC